MLALAPETYVGVLLETGMIASVMLAISRRFESANASGGFSMSV